MSARMLADHTRQMVALWPPRMLSLLDVVVNDESPAVREGALIKLLCLYTRELDEPLSRRWIEVTKS